MLVVLPQNLAYMGVSCGDGCANLEYPVQGLHDVLLECHLFHLFYVFHLLLIWLLRMPGCAVTMIDFG